MSFFREFKDDLSEAVDEMVSTEGTNDSVDDDDMVNTLTENVDVSDELSKLDGLLEKAASKVEVKNNTPAPAPANLNDIAPAAVHTTSVPTPASDENAIITPGMTINGDLDSSGSIEVEGRINGNIRCNGKLTVTGMINGNSSASEVFADAARIDGEINATGTVKVGAGSVVIGNITATSAVIAGAVKGDIDVKGPVVVDTSAIVMGNVKSRSVQINNGAVIEGFCSQAYAETDVASVFNG